jgi:CheY-like chemotaxis protein
MYEVKPIDLNVFVKETSGTIGMTKKEIRIHHELAEDLWRIKADQGQIEQVLFNLYVNAADAMPKGGDLFIKTINVTHEAMKGKPYLPRPGKYILLTVRDTGIGIDKDKIERIFEPFYTTKGLANGTGLGLASTYGIIKSHGGYIEAHSEKGQGSTFSIYLPATEEELKIEKKPKPELIKGVGTILLVDDEDVIIESCEQMIRALGYNVLTAKNGKEALEIFKENQDRIDMVILDMIMPDMNGGDTYDRLKKIDSDVKVLLSSGYSLDSKATEILNRGCCGFIQKPFYLNEMAQRIKEIIEEK